MGPGTLAQLPERTERQKRCHWRRIVALRNGKSFPPFFLAIVQVAPLANLDASTPHEAFMWLLASAGFWLPMIL